MSYACWFVCGWMWCVCLCVCLRSSKPDQNGTFEMKTTMPGKSAQEWRKESHDTLSHV